MCVEQSGRPFLIIKQSRVQSKPQLILIWGIPMEGHLPHNESGHLSTDQVDESKQVAPLPNRGDLLLWHPYTIHGSEKGAEELIRIPA